MSAIQAAEQRIAADVRYLSSDEMQGRSAESGGADRRLITLPIDGASLGCKQIYLAIPLFSRSLFPVLSICRNPMSASFSYRMARKKCHWS